jgi:F420-non-reducing hydrogenase small subunit
MAEKIKIGFLLLGGCAGCEMAVVDLSEKLVDALEHLEVVFWAPTAADVKYTDLENMQDNAIDVAFIDGMIRLDEHIHMARTMRTKAKTLIAFGVCASLGGTAGLGSLHTKDELFEKAFKNTPTPTIRMAFIRSRAAW